MNLLMRVAILLIFATGTTLSFGGDLDPGHAESVKLQARLEEILKEVQAMRNRKASGEEWDKKTAEINAEFTEEKLDQLRKQATRFFPHKQLHFWCIRDHMNKMLVESRTKASAHEQSFEGSLQEAAKLLEIKPPQFSAILSRVESVHLQSRLEAVLLEVKAMRKRNASDEEWNKRSLEATVEFMPVIYERLRANASRKAIHMQLHLWCLRDRMDKIFTDSRAEASYAEQDFEDNLREAAKVLGIKSTLPSIVSPQI